MKNTFLFLFAFIFIAAISSCNKEEINLLPAQAQGYLGTYKVSSSQRSGLHPIYDSIGDVIGHEEQWQNFDDPQLSITHIQGTDSLLINGLIFAFNANFRAEVKAVWDTDTLRFNQDGNLPSYYNNFVQGKIWLDADSIHLQYYWNKSDTYNQGATPEYGYVRGRGVRIN